MDSSSGQPSSRHDRREKFLTAGKLSQRLLRRGLLLAVAGFGAAALRAADLDLTVVGSVRARSAKEITSSSWSVGGETIDRGFSVYKNFRPYLGPLGAKSIRLQAGWAKCEPKAGEPYQWEWLDEVVNDALAQGVQPWLELSYGNRAYEGGGGPGLGEGIPTSPTALAAWDRWAKAAVERYRDRVKTWEIWNEPDLGPYIAPEAYLELLYRTATMIRAEQPDARIIGFALIRNFEFAGKVLDGLQAKNALGLIDTVTIHGYPRNPDDTTNIDAFQALLAKYGRAIEVREGETGAPSRMQGQFALKEISWTENMQAKYDLRRMLAHHGRDVPFNLFTMIDLHYTNYHLTPGTTLRMNYKGLLATNPDQTVSHVKPAYYAAQRVFAIFDDTLKRIPDYPSTNTSLRGVALTGYAHAGDGGQVVAYWNNDAPPGEANGVTLMDLVLPKGHFTEPVLVDLLTGRVHAIAATSWRQDDKGAAFTGLPVYDAPLLIAERAVLPLQPAAR